MKLLKNFLCTVFGRVSWSAPAWLNRLNHLRHKSPLAFWVVPALLLAAAIGWIYYTNLPKPWLLEAEMYAPEPAADHVGAEPNSLVMVFTYRDGANREQREQPRAVTSPARLDLIGKVIKEGVRLSPAKPGEWRWTGENTLEFKPETDWPAATEYTITVDKSIFAPEAELASNTFNFVTPPLQANIQSIEFYQDPQETSVRRVISTINFTHPVDPQSLKESITLAMRPSDSSVGTEPVPFQFSLNYSPTSRQAYLQSEPVELPENTNYMHLTISEGVKSSLGGEGLARKVTGRVVIPDISSYLKLEDSGVQIVRNESDEPEQVLSLVFTDEINEEELLSKLNVYLLPDTYKNKKTYWNSVAQVDNNVLQASKKVELNPIPNERDYSPRYSFKLNVPVNRGLYVKIDGGLRSINQFVRKTPTDVLLHTPEYPREVKIAGEGSVLTFSGSHQLRVLTRGVPALKYSIGRVLDGQLNHLITQSYGDISSPNFSNWSFNEQNLAEFSETIVDLAMKHPKEANYSSMDLSPWLNANDDNTGLFFVNVEAWDKKNNRPLYGAQDKRLIMITDLGVVLKSNANGSHEIFVQSVHTGQPVANAEVALLGKNGLPLLTQQTGSDGHAGFPAFNNSRDEDTPVVYTIRSGDDTSFIPYNRATRQLQLSRFDIGGEYSWANQDVQLKAYGFSSRGIYRPGDNVELGFIVKNADLGNVEGVPLEWRIFGPRGNKIKSQKVMLPKFGFLDVQFETDTIFDTGAYRAAIYLIQDRNRYRELGSTEFSLEEFQPDTLKINSRFVNVKPNGWSSKPGLELQVGLENLFGLPAQDRKLEATMRVRPATFAFPQYQPWSFKDPYGESEENRLTIDEELPPLRTNNEGKATYNLDLARFKGGTYRLDVTVEGFDQAGGRSVTSHNSILISPLQSLVGVKADGDLNYINLDRDRSLEFIAIDNELNKIARENLQLRRLEIQQVSTLVKQPNGTYQYQSVEREKVIRTEDFNIPLEGQTLKLDTSAPGDFAIELVDEQGLKVARVRYSVVGHGNLAGKLDKNAELQLKLNKSDYKPGEEIELSIRAPYLGAGLITIETDKVETWKWFNTDSESSVHRIRIPDHLEGGAYLHVALVRDINSKEIFSSPLSYAVEYFSLDKSSRQIDIDLNVPEITKPGESMTIEYSTSTLSRIAVFAVDEGILQVANYNLPKPLNFYLKKKALGVTTWQIMDLILPEFDVLKALSAAGGDTYGKELALAAKNLNPFQRKTDKPAVYWSGIIEAGPQTRTVNFDVPDTFSGTVRVMAVAVSEKALGSGQKSALVRGPFVISPQVLTSTVPGDEFKVVVGVSNIVEGSGENAEINVQLEASPHLRVIGDSSATLSIDEGSEGKASFNIKTLEKLGAAELTFTATYKNQSLSRGASLSIRPATPYRSSFISGYEKDGDAGLKVRRDLYAELASNHVSASASPLVLVDGLTNYLEHFPHGCTEQVVSQVFPLVGLMSHPAYGPHVENVQQHFSQLISKLAERQTNNGGFNFWPGSSEVAEYPSVYVAHFLIEAQNQGFAVPSSMLQRVQAWLREYSTTAASDIYQARVRANAIYLLTRMGMVTTNALVDLQDSLEKQFGDENWQSDLAAAYMAASYSLLKNSDMAEKLIDNYRLSHTDRKSYTDFDSVLTQDSQYVFLLAKHFPERVKRLKGDDILGLTEKVFRGEYNTIAAAYTVLALGAYSELALPQASAENITFKASLENASEKLLQTVFEPFARAAYPVEAEQIEIEGNAPLFYLDVQTGYDKRAPAEPVRQNLEVVRTFLDSNGNEVTTFEQGKELTVRLRVRTLDGEYRTNVAVVDLLPGGFEVERESVTRTAHGWQPDYVDIREDRVVYYGSFDSNVRELTYKVKLTAAGRFIVPPTHAESMYDRSVRASTVASAFTVTASQ